MLQKIDIEEVDITSAQSNYLAVLKSKVVEAESIYRSAITALLLGTDYRGEVVAITNNKIIVKKNAISSMGTEQPSGDRPS